MAEELSGQIEDLQKEIYDSVGHEFNINSPKQLADVLFNELDIPSPSKKVSTKESVLKEIVDYHPCIKKLLEYREINKIYGTYVQPLLEDVNSDSSGHGIKKDSVHTDFKQRELRPEDSLLSILTCKISHPRESLLRK